MSEDNNKWYGEQLEVKSDPLVDEGKGKAFIIRQFEFAFKPGLKKYPTRQELFNQHWPQIRAILWGDGIVASTDVAPRVLVDKRNYKIILLCEPKFRSVVVDKINTLQEVLNKKK